MGFYPKKLRNCKDLEREKALLLKEKRELEQEQLFSFEGILGSKKGESKESGQEGLGALLGFLPLSNPLVSLLIKTAKGMFSKKENEEACDKSIHTSRKPGKSFLKSIAVEFIGGYLKWKAIELTYKGIRLIIKSRKKK